MNENEVVLLPWVNEFVDRMKDRVEKGILTWCNIVTAIGLKENDLNGWITTYQDQIDTLLEDMNKDALNNQQNLIRQIESLLIQSEALCKELHIQKPNIGTQKLCLIDKQNLLVKNIEEYQLKIQERHKELNILEKKMKQVCQNLGRRPKSILVSPLPSEEQVLQYKADIALLEEEEYGRLEKFTELKTEIMTLANDLKYKPVLDFERKVLCEEDSVFEVTDSNMRELQKFYECLKEQSQNIKSEINLFYERVKVLWEVLEEDKQKCTEFIQKYSSHTLEDLQAFKDEVQRCEHLKRSNIEVFVKKLRQELLFYWDLCLVSERERKQFLYFYEDLFTEDLISLHDIEVEKWKKFYAENDAIFKLLSKWDQLYKRLQELGNAAVAPDRYKNRGGVLLKEEKERNVLNKQIPKLEEQLKELSYEYRLKNGKPFTVNGEDLDLILDKNIEDRENERKLKCSARKQRFQDKSLTPGRSLFPLTPLSQFSSIRSTCKRRIMTPSISTTKRSKQLLQAGLKTAPPNYPCLKVIGGRSRYSSDKKKKSRRRSKRNKLSPKTMNTTYDKFEEEVSNKGKCRSTDVFNGDLSPLAIPLPQTPTNRLRI